MILCIVISQADDMTMKHIAHHSLLSLLNILIHPLWINVLIYFKNNNKNLLTQNFWMVGLNLSVSIFKLYK